MLFSHPNGGDVNTALRKGFDSGVQDILEASNPYKETTIETFERLLHIPDRLSKEASSMWAAPPEIAYLTASLWIGRFDTFGQEARHLDLLRGEDENREEMGEIMLLGCCKSMKNRIVRDSEVSSHEVDEEIVSSHCQR
jgi:hypothetical protein